ncbi:GIY-YIG nuclease family protein [Vibrio alfacsensis]|uniref:GIY-YIG nuclease family protein n=1 Tax=Vibrio alfacsensis TaxID=1074311 RepID=UPI004067A2FE
MHRKEFGFSTLCNYGRFHKQWVKPTNKKQGRKGEKLSIGYFNSAGLTSSKVLKHIGKSHDADWMGLDWSEPEVLNTVSINVLDNTPAVYRIMDSASRDVLYIGETKELQSRLKAHAKKPWNGEETLFSFAQGADLSESHLRHEIEVDLIGAYFEEHQRVPCFQYGQLG